MQTFRELLEENRMVNEIKLTKRTDYKVIGREYARLMEYLYDARKYVSMCVFRVDGTWYYSVLVMRDMYLEPHSGVFLEDKFLQLNSALKMKDRAKIKELINDKKLMRKDGYTDTDSNFVKVLSYVFSFMSDYLDKKEVTDVKVMGNPRKFKIYKKLVEQNLETLPYKIIDEIDDEYTGKDGDTLEAKAILLKYKFA